MGPVLDKPKTEKVTHRGITKCGIRYAVSAMQGWRTEMEDAHVCMSEFVPKNWCFFGVFDGHAGARVAQYCSENLLDSILNRLKKGGEKEEYSVEEMESAVHAGFLTLDDHLRNLPEWANGEDHSGTTAVVAMVSPTHIIWANCGDSRGILCRNGELAFATEDHKPFNQAERLRIEKAGGTVMMQRVNGSLAVSRALGDFDYKRAVTLPAVEQLVSPEPDVTVMERNNEQDEFLLLACDGIYDVMQNEDIVKYLRHRMELKEDLAEICSDLIDKCLHKNSRDNMSVVLLAFPAAPKVSQEAIEQEKKLHHEACERILKRLKELVEEAQDSLELEESYIVHQLTSELPDNFEIGEKTQFISEKLAQLKEDRFGSCSIEDEFDDCSMEDKSFGENLSPTSSGAPPLIRIHGSNTDEDDRIPIQTEMCPSLGDEDANESMDISTATTDLANQTTSGELSINGGPALTTPITT